MRYNYFAAACLFAVSCSIVPPKIELTGERTMIERQIAGEYTEIEKNAWVVSNARTSAVNSKQDSRYSFSDEKINSASKIRMMNEDVIRKYKKDLAVGESVNGTLEYLKTGDYERSAGEKQRLLAVLKNENSARKDIIEYRAAASGRKIAEESRVFAEEQRSSAAKGEMIQNQSGKWVSKK